MKIHHILILNAEPERILIIRRIPLKMKIFWKKKTRNEKGETSANDEMKSYKLREPRNQPKILEILMKLEGKR